MKLQVLLLCEENTERSHCGGDVAKAIEGYSEARHTRGCLPATKLASTLPSPTCSANLDRLDQDLRSLAMPFAGDIEGRAMVDATVRTIGRPRVMLTPERSMPFAGCGIDLEAEQLDRDMPLVVIHGRRRRRIGRRAA